MKFAPALDEQSHLEIVWVVYAALLVETINSEEFAIAWAHERDVVCVSRIVWFAVAMAVVVENLSSENVVNDLFDNVVAEPYTKALV
jgi:predicted NUDIX family NTP pyrophosphohydrolase